MHDLESLKRKRNHLVLHAGPKFDLPFFLVDKGVKIGASSGSAGTGGGDYRRRTLRILLFMLTTMLMLIFNRQVRLGDNYLFLLVYHSTKAWGAHMPGTS